MSDSFKRAADGDIDGAGGPGKKRGKRHGNMKQLLGLQGNETEVNLDGKCVEFSSSAFLCEVMDACRHIIYLSARNNGIRDWDDMAQALKNNTTLTVLHLSSNNIL